MIKIELNQNLSAKFIDFAKNGAMRNAKAITTALRRCGDQLRNDAGTLAPYKTGNLRRSLTMLPVGTDKVIVGTNLDYARIQDLGGEIRAKNADYLTFKINGQWVKVKKVKIPKYRGEGYLTPAFKKLVDGDAQRIFTEEIERAINNPT